MSIGDIDETERPLIAPPSEMDDKTFVKHFNLRHTDALAGMGEIPHDAYADQVARYRAFHLQIHKGITPDFFAGHDHRTGNRSAEWQDGEPREDAE
jgi:hypothetical protein